MGSNRENIFAALLLLVTTGFAGCSSSPSILPDEVFSFDPTTAAKTKSQEYLESLPAPDETITVSVYSFNDFTGQNKPGEVPEYSKAVTQGGLPILKKALMDASGNRWFRVLERGGLQDLLQERQLIRSIREQYPGPDGNKLPDLGPLLYSGLLLEGGIVAYESNVYTGGLGARYLGIGGSTEYRRDIVTVYLRAVSVTSGEVLLSVNSSKTIYSTGLQGGIFKYVSFDKIVESEAGFTINEPPQLAVRQAIEMAVYSLIMEGSAKDLWKFADAAAGRKAYAAYQNRKSGKDSPLQEEEKIAADKAPAQLDTRAAAPSSNSTIAEKELDEANLRDIKSALTSSPDRPGSAEHAVVASSFDKPAATAVERPAERHIAAAVEKPAPPAGMVSRTASWTARAVKDVRHGWYVQYAAVRGADEEKKGGRIIGQLESSGLPVTIHLPDLTSALYRIMVGPYADQRVAQSVAKISWERLAADGWLVTPPYVKSIP